MATSTAPVITIKNLEMRYGDKQVLNGIDLEVMSGQIIGYIGPNGAGKSTTVKILLGVLSGYSGEVRVFGENIVSGDVEYKKRQAGCLRSDKSDLITPRPYRRGRETRADFL